ncbi:hypothetical protein [Devosia sp. CN2-171]|jgi:hypothetical protein|uniref:hypothetical protein n=1 Tax=Devosia sp. CN2-171 TaxID=3400909 RepID=UPI003BF8A748
MNKIIALVLVSATLLASAPAFAVDTSISTLCGPDAPEAYKRPGGYCEQIGKNESEAAKSEHPWWWGLK